MKTSAFLRPVRAATGNTRMWIQSCLARVDARQVLLDSPALILAIAVMALALPAISALQGNTTTADVSAEVNRTRSIAIGDIDGDGFPDIAVANEGNERNRVYFGDGSGGISSDVDLGNLEEVTDSIDLADVDQDGDLDVVIGNRSSSQPNRLYTFEAASRTFDLKSTSISDSTLLARVTSTARFGDINQDGDPDVVVANRETRNVIHFGNPAAGNFGFPNLSNLQDSQTSDSSSVAIGNLTSDACPDLVVGNRRNVRNDLYINSTGCGGYNTRRDLSTDADYTDWIEIADINGDGHNDVITANRLQRNKYLLGIGDGTFQPSKAISPDADYTRDIRAVDVDGDGDLDIIAANGAPAPNKLYLNRLMESGTLGFDAAIPLPGSSGDGIAIAVCGPPNCDFDGDGDVDLVFGNNGTLGSIPMLGAINRIVFNNNENPLFTSQPIEGATITFPYTYEVTAFDPDRAQVLTITGTGLGWLTLVDHGDGTATLSGQPGANLAAVLTVTDEDGLSANQNFSIVVDDSNQAPAISSGAPSPSVTQGTGLLPYDHLFTATDPDNAGSELNISAPTLPSWLTLVDNGDGTANLSGAPEQGDVGDHAVIVRVTDPAGRVDEESFDVTVVDGNDRPVAVNDNIQTTNGATVTRLGPQEPDLDATSVLWNDFDADGDVLVATLTEQAVAGTATVNPDGTFQYVHGGGGAGMDTFRYRASDGNGGQIQALVTIAIDVAADTVPPVITLLGDAVVTVTVGDAYTDAGATALDDVDGDVTADIIDTADSVDANTVGSHTVTYNVSDAAGNAAIEVTRTVNVVAITDTTPPVITLVGNASVSLTVGTAYTDAGATAVDDVDGVITANIVVTNPVNTAIAGTYTVLYNVSDSAGNAATEITRTVTVTAVAPPPPPPPPPRNSGGGSTGVLELLGMILLAGMSRRRMRLTRRSI